MKDLIKTIEARAGEISAYLAECQSEREAMLKRMKDLDMSEQRAQRELRMCNRAMDALQGEGEDELPPTEGQGIAPTMRYEGGFGG